MNKYLIEAIGTFFLVLTVGLSGNPIAIGVILIAMVYMGGYISGGYYNPAVTLAVYLRGRIKRSDAISYMIAQVAGGIVAAFMYEVIKEATFVPSPAADASLAAIVIVEVLFTFALASVVLHVATSDRVKDNDYYGLAIGFLLMAAAFAGGPISGGVFNPAVAIGPMLVDITSLAANARNLAVYIVAPLVGGVLAAWAYKLTVVHK